MESNDQELMQSNYTSNQKHKTGKEHKFMLKATPSIKTAQTESQEIN